MVQRARKQISDQVNGKVVERKEGEEKKDEQPNGQQYKPYARRKLLLH